MKFFHTITFVRRRKNEILTLKVTNEWIQDRRQIQYYFVKEFQEVFSSNNPLINNELEDLVGKKIFEDNKVLIEVSSE